MANNEVIRRMEIMQTLKHEHQSANNLFILYVPN